MNPGDSNSGPLPIGSRFQGYEIRALIGRGGHAWVYHGFHPFMGNHAAIKIITIPRDGKARETIQRAQAEAQFLGRFRHPNVVEVMHADITDDGLLYIVMEYLQGRSFYDVVKQERKLSIEETLTMSAQIADAIHAAHEAGAIHRDLKPANVFILKGNRVKVLDFGIAKLHDAVVVTREDLILGTSFYMSPEQILGRGISKQSDIYALGVMMDEALSGEHYLRRLARIKGRSLQTLPAVLRLIVGSDVENAQIAQIQEDPDDRPLHERDPGVPTYVSRLVDRCISKLLDQRFKSMLEVAEACRRAHARYLKEVADAGMGSHCRDLSRPAPPQVVQRISSITYEPQPATQRPVAPSDTDAFTGPRFFGAYGATPPPPAEAFGIQIATVRIPKPPEPAPQSPSFAAAPSGPTPRMWPEDRVASGQAPTVPVTPRPAATHGHNETLRLFQGNPSAEAAAPAYQYAASSQPPPRQPAIVVPAPQVVRQPEGPALRSTPSPAQRQRTAEPRTPAAALPSSARKKVTPNTVSPVASPTPPETRAVLSGPPVAKPLPVRTILIAAALGSIVFGSATLAYRQLARGDAAVTAAQASPVVIESVEVAPPAVAPPLASQPPAEPPPAPAPPETPVPAPNPAPAPPPAATAPPLERRAAAPSKPRPITSAAAPAPAPTPAARPKDLMDERLEMLEEELRRKEQKRDP